MGVSLSLLVFWGSFSKASFVFLYVQTDWHGKLDLRVPPPPPLPPFHRPTGELAIHDTGDGQRKLKLLSFS